MKIINLLCIFIFLSLPVMADTECRYKILNYPECCKNNECFYRIDSFEYQKPFKASVTVTVLKKITEHHLSAAAKEIFKLINGNHYQKVFIDWYLPGMKKNHGAWATTHFDPALQIIIRDYMLEHNPSSKS